MPIKIVPRKPQTKNISRDEKKKVSMKEAIDMRKDANRERSMAKGMLSGGQARLDKNKNNKIDAEDFKLLRKEKKGKPMKAVLGAMALGAAGALGAKKLFKKKKATATPGAKPIRTGIVGNLAEQKKKQLMGKRVGGEMKKDPTKPVNPFQKRPQKKSGVKSVLKKVGKGVGRFGVPGAIIGAAAAGAKKIADKIKEKKKLKGDVEGSTAPYKKMGGGMMQRPMGYKAGTMIKARGGGMARSKPTKMY